MDFGGIDHAFLVDHNGQVIFSLDKGQVMTNLKDIYPDRALRIEGDAEQLANSHRPPFFNPVFSTYRPYSAFLGPISTLILLISGPAPPFGRTYPAVRCKYRLASTRLANPNRLNNCAVFFSSPR